MESYSGAVAFAALYARVQGEQGEVEGAMFIGILPWPIILEQAKWQRGSSASDQ